MSDIQAIVATHALTSPVADTDTAAYIDTVTAEIEQLRGIMQRDQITIDRLKAESKIITDHTDSVLARLRVQIAALGRTA